jgi:hypothetical protein
MGRIPGLLMGALVEAFAGIYRKGWDWKCPLIVLLYTVMYTILLRMIERLRYEQT